MWNSPRTQRQRIQGDPWKPKPKNNSDKCAVSQGHFLTTMTDD